ncbi:MAG: D-glycero-beta-D-manno-heptose 1-phosphate adenylyltransferase [Candidatus Kryptoniota bacterium]
MSNIFSRDDLARIIGELRNAGKKIVFTNGVFDILHKGHVDYLNRAKSLGDALVVAVNSDSSVKRVKGERRPIVGENDRAFVVANLKSVDYVCLFGEDTPYETIKLIQPDVLVKGADWKIDDVVGKDIVEARGGEVVTIEYSNGKSTTNIINKILSEGSPGEN